jgi:putative redox protein
MKNTRSILLSNFSIQLHDKGRCQIRHELADAEIITDLPPQYGGSGRSFSSTDLVSAALGACILTSIDSILEREGYDPKKIKVSVIKTLSENPKMIKAISLKIFYPEKLGGVLLKKLERAIAACPVKRSLNEQVEIKTRFITGLDFP